MSGYTRTGLLFLMIAVFINLCGSVVAYGYYSTLNLEDIQGNLSSFLFLILPIGTIGVVSGLMYLLGAIFIFLGRKEFGERHRKNITYCVILIVAIIGIIMVFSALTFSTAFSRILTEQSQNTPTSTIDFFRAQLTYSLMQSSIIILLSGLVWVLALYNLEDKKGRTVLLAAFAIMMLTPIVNSIGTFRLLDQWIEQGTLDNLFNTTTSTTMYSELMPLSQWMGLSGILMLLVSLLSSLLLFVALFRAYKRTNPSEITPLVMTEETYHD